MDHEDESSAGNAGHQNLNDLHNYLTTFNKEIEPGEDVLSSMGVDTEVGDVGDLYTSSGGHSLQDSGEVAVTGQFSSGFYSEQEILDNALSDEAGQSMHSLDTMPDHHGEEDLTATIKQEVGTLDLDTVPEHLDCLREHVQLTDALQGQGLIMTSLADSFDPAAGKVIRILSLGEEGQYLTLGDGSQMQVLSQDLALNSTTAGDTSYAIQGTDAHSVKAAATRTRSLLSMPANSHLGLSGKSSTTATSLLTPASLSGATSNRSRISGVSQLAALQSTDGDLQPQFVALSSGTPFALSAEGLQQYGVLTTDGAGAAGDLGYQTISVVPTELNQESMNYVLVMAPQEGDDKQAVAQLVDIKQESQEVREELVEVNGELKRVLHVVPKKAFVTTAGSEGVTAGAQQQLMCDYCDYTSPKRYLLTRHMKSHSDERPHKCPECNRGFKTPASLINHVNTHTGTRPHKCKTCDAAFTTSGELVRHIRYRHTFEKPHRCPSCDYASVELSKLKRHMRSHTGERPYKCPHCRYASPDTYKLKRHLRIHTGEKPYECDICHARFTQSNSLKAHKLIHSGNKPVFQCTLCPTTCGRKTDLKIHFNKLHSIGSPLECKKCGQVLADRYSFKQHMRTHDMDRCFKCDQCDFIANTERSLDQHAAIHNKGRKFECSVCHMTFNLQQSLEKHSLHCRLDPGHKGNVTSKSNDEGTLSKLGDTGHSALTSEAGTLNSTSGKTGVGLGQDSFPTPVIASDTLHKNLMQDIKAGKLGDVPQVVIVHPDGSLEEIPAAAGDKLNLDDIFSTLSSTDKQEVNCKPEVTEETLSEGKAGKAKESVDEGKADEAGEMVQCEASTQVEIESDSESVDENKSLSSHTSSERRANQEEKVVAKATEIEKRAESSSESSSSEALKKAVENSPLLLKRLSSNSESDQTGALSVTVASSTSSSSSLSTSALGTTLCSTSQPEPVTSVSVIASTAQKSNAQACVSNSDDTSPVSGAPATTTTTPQYVVVKGYTCLSEDGNTVQPTLVNVAVDKDSLMKMFASLGPAGDGMGLQLLSGDLEAASETGEEPAGRIAQASIIHLHNMATLTGLGDAEDANSNLLGITSEETLTSRDSGLSELCGLAEGTFGGGSNKDSVFDSAHSLEVGEITQSDSTDLNREATTVSPDLGPEGKRFEAGQTSGDKEASLTLVKSTPLSQTDPPSSSNLIPKDTKLTKDQSQLLTSKASCVTDGMSASASATSDNMEPEVHLSLSSNALSEPSQLTDASRPPVFGMSEDDRSVSLQSTFCEAPPGNLFSDSLVEESPQGDLTLPDPELNAELDVGVEFEPSVQAEKSLITQLDIEEHQSVSEECLQQQTSKQKGSSKRKASSSPTVDASRVRTSKRVRKALVKVSM